MSEISGSGIPSSSCRPCNSRVSVSLWELGRAIRFGSTLPVRFILFLSTFLWGVGFLWLDDDHYHVIRAYDAFHQVTSPRVWSASFLTISFCIAWRIVDHRARQHWSRFINLLTLSFWVAVTVMRLKALPGIWPVMSTDMTMCVMAAWVALRSNVTQLDKETA